MKCMVDGYPVFHPVVVDRNKHCGQCFSGFTRVFTLCVSVLIIYSWLFFPLPAKLNGSSRGSFVV